MKHQQYKIFINVKLRYCIKSFRMVDIYFISCTWNIQVYILCGTAALIAFINLCICIYYSSGSAIVWKDNFEKDVFITSRSWIAACVRFPKNTLTLCFKVNFYVIYRASGFSVRSIGILRFGHHYCSVNQADSNLESKYLKFGKENVINTRCNFLKGSIVV